MLGNIGRSVASVGTALVAAVFSVSSSADDLPTRTIAFTGDAAPGTPTGVVYSGFDSPVINDAGQTAFFADISGPGVVGTNDGGLWSDGSGALELIARHGDAAPGTPVGVSYHSFLNTPILNNAGQTAFRSGLVGDGVIGTNNTGLWSEGGGALGLVARESDAAPGTPSGVVYNNFSNFLLNDAGQMAFLGFLAGDGVDFSNDLGIWSQGSGTLGPVAREGDAVPSLPGSVVYSLVIGGVLNDAGQVAFSGFLTGDGVDSTNDRAIWLQGSGPLGLVARSGDAAPGIPVGAVFSSFSNPVLNNAGQTAFLGFLTGGSVVSTNNTGIWSQQGGTLRLVAREGDAAPGAPVGVVFSNLDPPVINGAGQIAFLGRLPGTDPDGTNITGIWSERGGTLELVAREHTAAPGTPGGVMFNGFDYPVINGIGQVAFEGELAGIGVDGTNDQGIWATQPDGILTLIARTGDLFDVNDDPLVDDLRIISNASLVTNAGGEDGRRTSFNDNGELVYQLAFTDGASGIFVTALINHLIGDINGDGFVGVEDLDVLLANWGDSVEGTALASGDLSGDGIVGHADLDIVLGAWGDGMPPNVIIPEPGSLAALVLGAGLLLRRRR